MGALGWGGVRGTRRSHAFYPHPHPPPGGRPAPLEVKVNAVRNSRVLKVKARRRLSPGHLSRGLCGLNLRLSGLAYLQVDLVRGKPDNRYIQGSHVPSQVSSVFSTQATPLCLSPLFVRLCPEMHDYIDC